MKDRRKYNKLVRNSFCPTGPGGGVDPSCSPSSSSSIKELSLKETDALNTWKLNAWGKVKSSQKEGTELGKVFNDAINKLPSSTADSFRGIALHKSMIDTYKLGSVIDMKHSESFSGSKEFAEGWAAEHPSIVGPAAMDDRIPAVIQVPPSTKMRHLGGVQQELVNLPGLKLKVISTQLKDNVLYIHTKELTPITNAHKKPSPTKFDPTRTTTLRRAFVGKLRRKFARLRKAIYDLLVVEDALGLKKNLTYNVFCPTGPGGGVDPSCSPQTTTVVDGKTLTQEIKNRFPEGERQQHALSAAISDSPKYFNVLSMRDANGKLNGVASVWKESDEGDSEGMPKGKYIRAGNLATAEKGHGTQLLHELIKYADSKDAGLYLSSTERSAQFYKKSGMNEGLGATYYLTREEVKHRLSSPTANHIVKLPSGKYRLLSHEGKNLGTFDSREEAAKHEGEVEYFKHAANSFCPTGPGGGVDPTCSPGGSMSSSFDLPKEVKDNIDKHGMNGPFNVKEGGGWEKTLKSMGHSETTIAEVRQLFDFHRHGGPSQEKADSEIVRHLSEGTEIGKALRDQIRMEEGLREYWESTGRHVQKEKEKQQERSDLEYKWKNGMGNTDAYSSIEDQWEVEHAYKFKPLGDKLYYRKGGLDKDVVSTSENSSGAKSHSVSGSTSVQPHFKPTNKFTAKEMHAAGYRVLGGFGFNQMGYSGEAEVTWVKIPKLSTNERWRFNTTPEQLEAFKEWLKTQVEYYVTGMTDEELWRKFIESGFKKGAGRAFDDTKPQAGWTEAEGAFYAGTKDQFLRSAFGQPESVEKVQLLAARTFEELKGMSADLQTKVGRILVDGLTKGDGPVAIAREMGKQLELSRTRAETIAQTELIRAHAEGQLSGLEELGVEEVGVMVEWSTAADDRVCDLCEPMEGIVLKIEEARGMIPRHPRCRCAFTPANVGEPTDDQKRGKRKIVKAVKVSASLGRDEFSTAVPVTKERPKSVLPVIANAFCPTGPGGGQDNSCSPFSTSAVDFGEDVHKQYKDAPKIRVTDEDVRNVKSALKLRGALNKDGTVTLYHDTIDDPETISSILKHGLIPSAQPASGQTWKATHSSYSTYFHQDLSAARGLQSTAADEFLTTIEARIPVTKEFLKRVIPDEESGGVHEGVAQLISGAGAPAVIGGVPAKYLSSRKYSKPAEPKPTKTSRTTHPHEDSILQAAGELNGSKYKGRLSIGERISSKLYKESGKKINLSGAEVNEVLKQHSSELSKYGISINTQPAPSVVYQFSQLLAGARK